MKKRTTFLVYFFLLSVCSQAQTPSANFTSDIRSGCSPIIVDFRDLTVGATSLLWDFGNGATSTKKNPSTTYFTPGAYTVKLTATNANGSNTVTKQQYITVYDQPTVEFTSDKTGGCSPLKIQFNDVSTAGSGNKNVAWVWDFGYGIQSNEQNPVATFKSAGDFNVLLKVTNDKGCTKFISKQSYIKATEGVVINFSNSSLTTCNPPALVNFTNNSSGPGQLSYLWNLGDGNTSTDRSLAHTYNSTGRFPVSLAVTSSSGCTDTLKYDTLIQVTGIKTDFSIPNPICVNSGVRFLNITNSTPSSTLWEFSDGQSYASKNAFRFFDNPGSYTIKLTNFYSTCSETIIKTLNLSPTPTANFIADSINCKPPFNVTFQNLTNNGASYKWDFGDSKQSLEINPSHTYNSYGNFQVKLIAFNETGCSDTIQKPTYIKINKPEVAFSNLPRGGCAPFAISPVADIKSLDAVTAYLWNFGDGTTSTEQFPTHTYSNVGTYTVTLTIKTAAGCTETFSLPAAVKAGTKPKPDFIAQPRNVCAKENVNFINQSTDADKYLWFFGDGGTSTLKDPAYQYNDLEWFDVKLIAYNNGCPDSITRPRYIYIKPPIASFLYSPDCNKRFEYTFKDQSLGAKTWQWNFGDGTTSNEQNPPAHTYKALGNYTVTLKVTNDSCEHQTTRVIKVNNNKPDFNATPRVACKPADIEFKPLVRDTSVIANYLWSFGEQTSATTKGSTRHAYTRVGSYDITLVTTDIFGCKDTVEKKQYIRINGPVARFTGNDVNGCSGITSVFADSSLSDGVNKIVSWKWDFGDSTAQTFQNPPFQHTYNDVGYYNVKLTVKDAAGCVDSFENANFVKVSYLKANWYSERLTCPNSPIGFVNQTVGSGINTLWDFGDGITTNVISPEHTYSDTGLYSVTLKISNEIGCIDSLTRKIAVGRPVASFTVNNVVSFCTPFQAVFKNTSKFINSSFWHLGAGTSMQAHPINYYAQKGVYDVKLVVTSPGGCKDSATSVITVKGIEDAQLNYNPLNGCNPLTVDLNAFTKMNGRFIWDLGDGNIVDTSNNAITHRYTDIGKFVPKVILQELTGCLIPLTGIDTIRIRGAKANFTINNQFFCDSGSIVTVDSTTFNEPVTGYNWDFGDGNTSTTQNPIHKYVTPGIYTITLAVKTVSGCIDTMRLNEPVKIVASPLINISGDSVICVNERMRQAGVFERPDSSAVKWLWQFPNGNKAFIQYPANQQYNNSGSFIVTAIATNSSGCTDTMLKNILVNPIPTVTMPPVITMQAGFPVVIPAIYTSNVVGYNWAPSATLNCINCPQPIASPKFDTKYTVSFIDSNGCRNTGEVQIVIMCKNSNVFIPNTFSPNADGNNDIFYVRGQGLERVKSFRVFNRWGEVVFEKTNFRVNDAITGWDGRYRGKPQPDVYVYQVEVYCDNGDIIRFEGNVALIQ
ncbi:MAG: PKD domain-containing protein [Chitinophagaceae bacterium]